MKIETRAHGVELTEDLAAHIDSRLRLALTRFQGRIRRVHVLLEDVNGPRGGNDLHCKLQADLAPRGSVVIVGMHDEPFSAVARAAERASTAIARRVQLLNARRRGRTGRLTPVRGAWRAHRDRPAKEARVSHAH